MSVFQERLNGHQLPKDLQKLSNELEAVLKTKLDPDQASLVRRTKRILDRFQQELEKTDPELLTASMLDSPNQHVTALREAITASKESGDWAVLLKKGDAVLHHLSNLIPAMPPQDAEKEYREALDEYRDSVAARLEESEKVLKQHLKAVADAKARIDAQSQEVTQTVEDGKQSIAEMQENLRQLEESRSRTEEELQKTTEKVNSLSNKADTFLSGIEQDSKERTEKLRTDHEQWFKAQESRWNELQSQKETEFTGKVNEWNTTFTNAENKRQENFTAKQNERATEFSSWKNETQAEAEELIANWTKQLSDSHKEQVDTFEQLRKTQTAKFSEVQKKFSEDSGKLLSDSKTAFQEQRQTEAAASAEHLSEIEKSLAEARSLVGLVSNTAITGSYQRIANQEHKTADIFRWFSIVALGGLIVLACFIVWNVSTSDFNWEVALFRLLAGIPFAAMAWYCGRESSRHRVNEERNRKIELELTALEPFLKQLEDDKAKEARGKLISNYFGTGNSNLSQVDGRPLEELLRDALRPLYPIADLIKQATK